MFRDFLDVVRDFLDMLRDSPRWFKIWLVICFVLGTSLTVYAFYECGWKALVLGNHAGFAAFMDMCD